MKFPDDRTIRLAFRTPLRIVALLAALGSFVTFFTLFEPGPYAGMGPLSYAFAIPLGLMILSETGELPIGYVVVGGFQLLFIFSALCFYILNEEEKETKWWEE